MMCSLVDSPFPPNEGLITLFEVNGELVTALCGETDLNKHSPVIQGLTFPRVTQAVDTLSSLATDEDAKSAFLPRDTHLSLWKKAWYACKEQGICGMLDELANSRTEAPWMITAISCSCLAAIRCANSMHGTLYPHLVLPNEEMVSVFSATCNWQESRVRVLAWHPHINKCAIAWNDDVVKVFTANSEVVPTLKHRVQRSIADMAWKPLSASVLAIACQSCLLIWHIDPSSNSTRPSANCVQVLSEGGHGPITSIAWDPRGRMLVSASPSDTAIQVWDVPRETCMALRRSGGGGVTFLRWSADSTKLFAATPSHMFRVWETQTWTCEKWTGLSGRCQVACWSPDSTVLLFCTNQETVIFALRFKEMTNAIDGSQTAVNCADLSQVFLQSKGQDIRVGGLIQDMEWDPTGERLAVLFEQSNNTVNYLIALFSSRMHPVLQLIPSGFVRGEPDEIPRLISFQPNFKHGALLTVGWHTGKVSFIPLIFMAAKTIGDNASLFSEAQETLPSTRELFSNLQSW